MTSVGDAWENCLPLPSRVPTCHQDDNISCGTILRPKGASAVNPEGSCTDFFSPQCRTVRGLMPPIDDQRQILPIAGSFNELLQHLYEL